MDSVGAPGFSTDRNDEFSHMLILDALQNIDTSTMSSRARSEFIHWLNYNSPISPMYINQTLSSLADRNDWFGYMLIIDDLRDIDTSNMSSGALSEFIHWLNSNSPISPRNINLTLSSLAATRQQHYSHPQHQHLYHSPEPLSYSTSFATRYPRIRPSFSSLQPALPVPQQFNNDYMFPSYYPMMPQYTFVPSPVELVDDTFVMEVMEGTSSEYEEMLQLQEQIGHVNVGLSMKTITENLKTSRISAANKVKQEEDDGEVCSVCQEEYEHNEMIGTLECGHKYHANCIKEWLLHKNVCPLCKATALVVKN